ncbi:putative quinol monooxygenase [Azospirillum sp. SYSU D00513]|uniref:putative quinol monooxygenase n=1 Tax=Azospirillum sp. SYSU D00513 TaxID=2812561 RepID=UPI001A969B2D|nr:putative quinol monooxygenase [Azospirillum sp. SYSU D00513]
MAVLTNAAFFTAKPGRGEELGARLLDLVAPTRREPGCLRYDIYRSTDLADAWFVLEEWRSRADFDAHMQTPYVAAFMMLVPELCEGEVEICGYEMRSQPADRGNEA